MIRQEVILVDKLDRAIGSEEKMKAHQQGLLHRAFSVFIVNNKGELLLQKRAGSKYHSAGLWTNTCCSHPAPGQDIRLAAEKRLLEEMGFTCPLSWLFKFMYKTSLENKLIEYEWDHVFIGRFNANPIPDPNEVEDWQWVDLEFLKVEVRRNPHPYTFWLRHVYHRFFNTYIAQKKQKDERAKPYHK